MYIISNELKHYGVFGMKWGIRRYQDKNGKLTDAGKARYSGKDTKRGKEAFKNAEEAAWAKKRTTKKEKKLNKKIVRTERKEKLSKSEERKLEIRKAKRDEHRREIEALTKEYNTSIETAKRYAKPQIVKKILSKRFNEKKAASNYRWSNRRWMAPLNTHDSIIPTFTRDNIKTDMYTRLITSDWK